MLAAIGLAGFLLLSATAGVGAATSTQGIRLNVAKSSPALIHASDTSDTNEFGGPVDLQLGHWSARVWNHGAYYLNARATISWVSDDSRHHTEMYWFRKCTEPGAVVCDNFLHAADCCIYKDPGEIDGIPDNAEITVHFFTGGPGHSSFGGPYLRNEFPSTQQPPKSTVPNGLCFNTWGTLNNVWYRPC